MQWDLITNIILIASIITLGVFVVLGLYQWITRGKISKVDPQLLWLPLPLILMVITYFLFDKVFILNTRPDGSGEPSFPSSHVMVVTTIFFLITLILPHYVKNKTLCLILELIMVVLIGLTCTGRILANKHWWSDVLGGVIFAFIFSEIYYLIIKSNKKSPKRLRHKS
ncbi:phosphatase PAP2 family protein [Candidatus Saccharibacteria bacterium]|nr:phosphatase PAP2 family protein [Candidatus Saccharibacteria bacterium]